MTRDAQIEQIETIVSACLRHGGFAHGFWVGLCPAHRAEIAALTAAAEQQIAALTTALAAAKAEIAVSDQLLADRQRILDAYPCPQHGPCVPHVLELIARLSALLRSACAIAERRGAGTAWERFIESVYALGLNGVTARTYRVLPGEAPTPETSAQAPLEPPCPDCGQPRHSPGDCYVPAEPTTRLDA